MHALRMYVSPYHFTETTHNSCSEEMSAAGDQQNVPNARRSEVCARGHRIAVVGGLLSAVGFSWYVAVFFVPMTTDDAHSPEACRKQLDIGYNTDGLSKSSVGGSGLRIAESMSVTMQVAGVMFVVMYVVYAISAWVGRHGLKTSAALFIFTFCFLLSFFIFYQTSDFPSQCFSMTSTTVAMVTMGASGSAQLVASHLWLAAGLMCSGLRWSQSYGVVRGRGEGQPLLASNAA